MSPLKRSGSSRDMSETDASDPRHAGRKTSSLSSERCLRWRNKPDIENRARWRRESGSLDACTAAPMRSSNDAIAGFAAPDANPPLLAGDGKGAKVGAANTTGRGSAEPAEHQTTPVESCCFDPGANSLLFGCLGGSNSLIR